MNKLLPRRLDPRTLAGATLAALAPGLALAGPQGESVVAGVASVGRPDALTTLVQQTSASAVINWQQFNVGASEFVVFQQPSSSSVVLNRVIGNDASQIFGSISANGRVFLANPNGVLFAPGSRLDLNGLVATTFGISDEDFMAGRYQFARAPGAPDAGVVNQGAVQTASGGFVVLAGDFARNEGVIAAPAGSVLLAAGARTTLNLDGMGLVDFAVDEPTLSAAAGVSNAGQILAEGGMVVMTARVANQLVSTVVNNSGLVRASRIADQGGELWLVGEGGDVANSGVLDASGVDGDAGRVVLYGDQDVAHSGTVVADGAGGGAGGEVRAIAAGTLTVAEGSVISARGGSDSESAGGMVEVSGHGLLHLRGHIDVGTGGQLLIDPATVTLMNGASSVAGGSVGSIHVQFINAQLALGNDVKVIASSSIGASTSAADIVSANPNGDLLLEIGTSAPACSSGIADGVCLAPFGAFTATPGGSINLADIDINIAGALFIDATLGGIQLGSVTAGAIAANDMSDRFDTFSATTLTSTVGGIDLFGRHNIAISGAVSAAGGFRAEAINGTAPAQVQLFGGVAAGGQVTIQVGAQSGNGGIQVIGGSVSAGGGVDLGVQALSGAANIQLSDGIAASGAVQLDATDIGGSLPGTGITLGLGITGAAVTVHTNSNYNGGDVNIGGAITATAGAIDIQATGDGPSPSANVNVSGAVNATGSVQILANDLNGAGGGVISVAAISGASIVVDAQGTGIGSGGAGGQILIGTSVGPNLIGGAVSTPGNATITANSDNANGGVIVVGDTSVGGDLTVTVTGGPNGGFIAFADSMGSAGTVNAAATISAGGDLVANLLGDAGWFEAGDITADLIGINLQRNLPTPRAISVTTGNLIGTGAGPSDYVFLAAENHLSSGAATLTTGNVTAGGLDVTLVTTAAGSDLSTINAGDISGALVTVDNDIFGGPNGSVTIGNVTGVGLRLWARDSLTALDLAATDFIDAEASAGNLAVGNVSAVSASNPVNISLQVDGVGATLGVGAITAQGRRAASGPFDAGAFVDLHAGPNASAIVVSGAVDIDGIGNTFAGSGSDSISTFTRSGVLGAAVLNVVAVSPTSTVSFLGPGGVDIDGVGEAMMSVQAGSVTVSGPVTITATPGDLVTNGTLFSGACSVTCSVTFTETIDDHGDAMMQVAASDPLGIVDLGTVTVGGPQASIELYGANIQTAALAATGGANHYQRSSGGTIGAVPHSFSDDFTGGGADVRLFTGVGTTGISVSGDITVVAPGFAGVLLAADSIAVGSITTTATGGLFVRGGQAANPAFADEGPFGQQIGELPPLTSGTITGGFALIEVGDDAGCSACGLSAATTVNIAGTLSASAPGTAIIDLNATTTGVAGAVTAVATTGSRVGVNQFAFVDSSSVAYDATENVDFTGGEARIFVNGDGALTVGGAMTAAGAFASIDLGISSGTLQAITLDITGGAALFSGTYDAAGTADDYTVSFQGPGAIQGLVVGPDAGGGGTIVIGGPIDVDAVGFGAVIVRAGSVTTGAIDLDVTTSPYTYFDSRVDGAPVNVTVGDALLAVHGATGPGLFNQATVNGTVTVNAQGSIELRSQFVNGADVTLLDAGNAVTEVLPGYLDRINQISCDGAPCSLGSYAPVDLDLWAGDLHATNGIFLPTGSLAFGGGAVATGAGDALVVAQYGLSNPDPNGALRTFGQVDVGNLELNGGYLLVLADAFGAIGTGVVGAGGVVQFARAGGGTLQLEQSGSGPGVVSATDDLAAFAGQGAQLVLGHSGLAGDVQVAQLGPVNLAAENLMLIGSSGITGATALSANALTLWAGTSAIALDTAASSIDLQTTGAVLLDNLAFAGPTVVTLTASPSSLVIDSGGNLTINGAFTGTVFDIGATGDLVLNSAITASTAATLATGGAFSSAGLVTTPALDLVGAGGVTDFFVTTQTVAIVVGAANSIVIDNTAQSGPTALDIPGASPSYLDVTTGGTLQLSNEFNGGDLHLNAAAIDTGGGNHVATGTISLTTGGPLVTGGTLDATSLLVDATATTAINLFSASGNISIDEAASLVLDNSGFGGGAVLFLPVGIGSATITFGGNGQVNGDFAGSTFVVSAAGNLDLVGSSFSASTSMSLTTGASFFTSGALQTPTLSLQGLAGVTDFFAVTDAGAISIAGANTVALNNSAHLAPTSVAIAGPSPTALDVAAGGSLTLSGAFVGVDLTLSGADLDLGTAAHTATGTISLTTAGGLVTPNLITASTLLIDAAPTTVLALQTDTAALFIDEGSSLTLDNSAETGAVSMTLPAGATALDLTFGGSANVSGSFSGTSLSITTPGDLNLSGAGFVSSGTLALSTGGFFSTTGLLGATLLVLDGAVGVTDFFAITDAQTIQIDGANAVALDNSASTRIATFVVLLGTSPGSLDVFATNDVVLNGAFTGTTLTLSGGSIDVGTSAHSASAAMTFVSDATITASGLLTTGALSATVNAGGLGLVLTTNTGSINVTGPLANLGIDNSAFTAPVSLALPGGLDGANLVFGGDATINGGFAGSSFLVDAAGNLDLNGPSYASSSAMTLITGGTFFSAGPLSAPTLNLAGVTGLTDFIATTTVGALSIDGADAVVLDNTTHGGPLSITLVGVSPAALDIATGGSLALIGQFDGTSLTLSGASLALGTASHSASGAIDLTSAGTVTATGVLTAGSLSVATSSASPLAFTTNTASINISTPGGSTLSINNNAYTGAISFALPGGLTIANLAFGGDATLSGAFNGSSLNFAAGGDLVLSGGTYATSGTMRLEGDTGISASGMLTAGTLQLIDTSGTAVASLTTNAGAITLDGWGALNIDNTARTGPTVIDFGIFTPDNLDFATGGALALAEQFVGASLALQGSSLDLGTFSHSATGGIVLITEGALISTGTLGGASLFIDGAATTAVALATTTADLFIAEAGSVMIDATPTGGSLSLGFGSAPFGAVDVGCIGDVLLNTGITATSFALAASGSVDDGSGVPALARADRVGGVAALAQGRVLAGTVTADTVFVEANGDLRLGGTTFVIGLGDGVTGVSDTTLLAALADESIGPGTQLVSNGTFLAGGALELDSISSTGSYLVLQGDSLSLSGSIAGPSDLLVQVAPATGSNTFSLEESAPGSADTNYTFLGQLDGISARTLVIGASTMSGAATIGANGVFDVTPINLIVATSGVVTGIGNVTSTGIVNTLQGLIDGPVVQPPILEEIDPLVADPAPPVDTSAGVAEPGDGDAGDDDEDEEGEDVSDADDDEGEGTSSLVSQQSPPPAGVCGK